MQGKVFPPLKSVLTLFSKAKSNRESFARQYKLAEYAKFSFFTTYIKRNFQLFLTISI